MTKQPALASGAPHSTKLKNSDCKTWEQRVQSRTMLNRLISLRRYALASVCGILALVTAGCGSSGNKSTSATTAGSTGSASGSTSTGGTAGTAGTAGNTASAPGVTPT